MPRTIRVTMEILIDHLPIDEIDDIAEYAAEEGMTDEEAAACVLSEAGAGEVAECLMLGTLDPDIFGGSMLYLKVLQAKVTEAKWQDETPTTPPNHHARLPAELKKGMQ